MKIEKILRAMKKDEDGSPRCANSSSGIGVRHKYNCEDERLHDVILDDEDHIHPNTGGMSVSPPPSSNIPMRLKRGRGVFTISTSLLIQYGLQYRQDPRNNTHGFVEPRERVHISEYESALVSTKYEWLEEQDDEPETPA